MPRMKAISRPKETKKETAKATPKAAPKADPKVLAPVSAGGDEPPKDVHAFREALARRIQQLIARELRCWRTCALPACRRARACRLSPHGCPALPPLPEETEEEAARTRANVQRLLRELVARGRRAEADGIDQQS